jgi:hypothetical protein
MFEVGVVESVFFPFPFFSFIMRVLLLVHQGHGSTQTLLEDWNFYSSHKRFGFANAGPRARKPELCGGSAAPFDSASLTQGKLKD